MKDELLTRMIHLYGFEHPAVIQFAELIERGISNETLQTIVESHETYGTVFEFEEEEEDLLP